MMKLLGGALILFAGFVASSHYANTERERIERLRELVFFIRYVKDKVECYSMPMDQILDSCKESILRNLGVKKKVSALSELFDECAPFGGEEIKSILERFCLDFGKGYREHQVKLCESTANAVESHLKKLESTYPTRKKTATTLCFAVGGIVLIALL